MIPLVQSLGIDGRVKQHKNPVFLVSRHQMIPGEGDHGNQATCRQQKPPEAHAAGKGHAGKDKYEDQ